jgi:hypothetical protein
MGVLTTVYKLILDWGSNGLCAMAVDGSGGRRGRVTKVPRCSTQGEAGHVTLRRLGAG